MKKLLALALAAWVLSIGALAAGEIDMDYTGRVDTYTGAPVESAGAQVGSRVEVTDSVGYDRETGLFCYMVEGVSQELRASVMDGMITRNTVRIVLPTGVVASLYRDGAEDTQPLDSVSEPGNYVLNAKSGGGGTVQVFSFTIVGQYTGQVESYRMPSGFIVTELKIDGNESEFGDYAVNFTQEGVYELEYTCYKTGVDYSLSTIVDHTPPALELSGIQDGVIRGVVRLPEVEEGAVLSVVKDGEVIGATGPLTQLGHYRVTVTDRAGNSTDEEFTIMLYFDISSIAFILLIAGLAVGLTAYLVKYRMSLRVR